MKFDVLDWMQLSSRTTKNVGAYDVRTPIDPKSGYGQIKRLKALGTDGKADKWDLNLYDENFVYSWITELGDHTPRDYKKFIANHTNPVNRKVEDGITMFPRYIDSMSNNWVTPTMKVSTRYRLHRDCKWDNKINDLGDVVHILQGPFMYDIGGDIGLQPTLVHQYFWMDNGVPACEENWYVWQFGWLRWCLKHFNAASGMYLSNATTNHKDDKVVIHNKVLNGGAPEVYFPCF